MVPIVIGWSLSTFLPGAFYGHAASGDVDVLFVCFEWVCYRFLLSSDGSTWNLEMENDALKGNDFGGTYIL